MKFVIPRGTKTLYKQLDYTARWWVQIHPEHIPDKVITKITQLINRRKGKLKPHVMLHVCKGDVPPHCDDISRSCYVLPVVVHGEWEFSCEDRKVKLKEGEMFKFSTFDRHSLIKLNGGMCVFYTVDYI